MTARRAAVPAVLALALAFASVGCVTYRGPRDLQDVIAEQTGADPERTFGLKMGWVSTKLTAGIVHLADADDDLPLQGLTGVKLATYDVPHPAEGRKGAFDLRRCEMPGWETVVRSRDGNDQILIQMKVAGDSVKGLTIIAVDDDELVYVSLRGNLDRSIETVMRDTAHHKGARGMKESLLASAGR